MRVVALTIAGSDSGGGAGIQADLKTFHAFGVFGTSAVTAVTVQNTLGVAGVHLVPVEVVAAQVRAVAEDLRPAAVKTGMLGTAALVAGVARAIEAEALQNYVLDPVMVATSGQRLLEQAAEAAVAARLVPLCRLVTPNLDEAALLTGLEGRDPATMAAQARRLVDGLGAAAALVKGGHLGGGEVVDVLYADGELKVWRRPRIATASTHGTGCTLSAAVTAGLALGRPLERAVEDALEYVNRAIRHAPGLGGGHGPLDHMVAAPDAGAANGEAAAGELTG
jgi:hydroxymethylpyrimidine/phosphomethylpyrimidine kinase